MTTELDDGIDLDLGVRRIDSVDEGRAFAAVSASLLGTNADPSKIGRFEVLRRVGAGGMGVVYAAYDPQLDRKVAIKLLLPGRSSRKGQDRLMREAKALARLNHPNVVGVHEVGRVDDRVFIAMELVDGMPMSTWLRTARPWKEVVRTAIEAGRGLAAAHDAGIVHRDFKPANVMLQSNGRVVVLDFGLARWNETADSREDTAHNLREPTDGKTVPSAIAGTPAYMAPEQHLGHAVDAKSDQFAFCVSVYEAAYGERPFAASTRLGLVDAIDNGDFRPRPRSRRVPPWLLRALRRGLQPAPDDRWPSMEALVDTLERGLAPRWRRAVAPSAVLASVAGAVVVSTSDREPSCAEASAIVERTWNEMVAQRVQQRLGAVDHPSAAHMPALVRSQIDAYTSGWRTQWQDACEADRATEGGDATARGAMNCLEVQLRWLASSLELFETPTVPLLVEANRLVPSEANLEMCHDSAVEATTPDEERHRVEAKLNECAVLLRAGDYRATEALLDELEATADEGLRARVHRQRGLLYAEQNQYVQAREELERALLEAERSGDTVARLSTLRSLAAALLEIGELERSAQLLAQVDAAHERFETRPLEWDDELRSLRMSLQSLQGEHEEATRTGERRLERLAHSSDEDRKLRARIALVRVRIRGRSFDGLDAELDSIERGVLALYGPVHHLAGDVHSQRGSLAYYQGELDEAIASTQRSIEIRKQLGRSETALLKVYNNLGAMQARSGNFDAAAKTWNSAARIARAHRPVYDRRLMNLAHNLAGIEAQRGNYDQQLLLERESLRLSIALNGEEHETSINRMYEVARALQLSAQASESIPVLDRAIELERRTRGEKTSTYALLLSELAAVYDGMSDQRRALSLAAEAFGILDEDDAKTNPKRYVDIALVYVIVLQRQRDQQATTEALRVLDAIVRFEDDRRVGPMARSKITRNREQLDPLR